MVSESPESSGRHSVFEQTALVKLPFKATEPFWELVKRLAWSAVLLLISTLIVWVDRDSYVDSTAGDGVSLIDAFYYSTVTVTTTGYGDITPVTTIERVYATFSQLVGASIFAYVVGAVCGIITSLDEKNTEFYEVMDSVNNYSREAGLPQELRVRLRNFFRYKRNNLTLNNYQTLLMQLTPTLRSEVVMHSHLRSVINVPFLRYAPDAFVLRLSNIMHPQTFAPSETIVREYATPLNLYIIKKGISASHGIIYGVGKFIGLDAIHSNREHMYRLLTLTFVETFAIDRDRFVQVTDEFPHVYTQVRAVAVKFVFRMHVRAYLRALRRLADPQMSVDALFGGGCGILVRVYYTKLRPYYETCKLFGMSPDSISSANRAACVLQRVARRWLARKVIAEMRKRAKEMVAANNMELEMLMQAERALDGSDDANPLSSNLAHRVGDEEYMESIISANVHSYGEDAMGFQANGAMGAKGKTKNRGRYGRSTSRGTRSGFGEGLPSGNPPISSAIVRDGDANPHEEQRRPSLSVSGVDAEPPSPSAGGEATPLTAGQLMMVNELFDRIESLEDRLIERIDTGRLKANAKLDMQIKRLRNEILGKFAAIEKVVEQSDRSARPGGSSTSSDAPARRKANFKGARF